MKSNPILLVSFVCFTLLNGSLGGCKDVRVDAGTDTTFLHTPEELFAKVDSPTKSLFPDQVGNTWTVSLMDKEKTTEQQVLLGKRVISGVECQVISTQHDGHSYREEYYVSNKKGIYHLGGGVGEQVIMVPPVPILLYPLEAGKTIEWQGGISVVKGKVPARAWSHFRGTEDIKLAKQSFKAYRTETALEANVGGRLTDFMTTRWFVPGIGIVKTRYIIRQVGMPVKEFRRELVSYKVAP